MVLTAKQFKNQTKFWQDAYYSYAIHKTDGGAIYLYRISGKKIDKNTLKNMETFRLDGIDKEVFIKNVSEII